MDLETAVKFEQFGTRVFVCTQSCRDLPYPNARVQTAQISSPWQRTLQKLIVATRGRKFFPGVRQVSRSRTPVILVSHRNQLALGFLLHLNPLGFTRP